MNNRWMAQKKRIRCRKRKATENQIWALIWALGPVCLWISLNKMPYWCALYRSFVLCFFSHFDSRIPARHVSINQSFVRSFVRFFLHLTLLCCLCEFHYFILFTSMWIRFKPFFNSIMIGFWVFLSYLT